MAYPKYQLVIIQILETQTQLNFAHVQNFVVIPLCKPQIQRIGFYWNSKVGRPNSYGNAAHFPSVVPQFE